MATTATIKKNIAKLEAALKSKATPKSLKPKLETQLVKSKAELSGMNKGTKPKTSSTKSTQTALQKLKAMVNKNKKYKTYKGAGVDLEKDADRPALRTGRRIAKESGKTYYEYRANRIDVKQPPKKYPKLEKGGEIDSEAMMLANNAAWDNQELRAEYKSLKKDLQNLNNGLLKPSKVIGTGYKSSAIAKRLAKEWLEKNIAVFEKTLEIRGAIDDDGYMAKGGEMKHDKLDEMVEKYQTWLDKNNLPQMSADELLVDESVNLTKEQRKYIQNFSNEWDEEQDKYAKGGYYAKGGSLSSIKEEYDENEDNNAHSENVVLLAKHFGTKEDLTEAKRILALHEKEGSLSIENGKKRHVLHLKLIEKARTEMAKDGIEFEKGGYMAKGGEMAQVNKMSKDELKNWLSENYGFRGVDGKGITKEVKDRTIENMRKEVLSQMKYNEKNNIKYADGGISEKEVVESNAEMVLSQIKAVKHHAMELSNVVSKNSDIEAWVVAKIERASTDLSDITHYLEYQTKKMAMGGEIHRTQE